MIEDANTRLMTQLSAPPIASNTSGVATASLPALRATVFEAAVNELAPVGFAELMLVRDIARHGAQSLHDDAAADAIRRQSDEVLSGAAEAAELGAIFTSMGVSKQLDNLARRSAANSNILFQRLRQLTTLQYERVSRTPALREPDSRFSSEESCIAYLVHRFQYGVQSCPGCGQSGAGSWIAARRCWQCSQCRRQAAIAHGTVMSGSHLELVKWFHAIRVVLVCPNIRPGELAKAVGIPRPGTARSVLRRIRRAIADDRASVLLAGLDQTYFPG
jgi:hypothetical protein